MSVWIRLSWLRSSAGGTKANCAISVAGPISVFVDLMTWSTAMSATAALTPGEVFPSGRSRR